MINKDLTEIEILKAKAELRKKHAEIFRMADALNTAMAALGTLPTHRPQEDHDIQWVEERFEQLKITNLLVKE